MRLRRRFYSCISWVIARSCFSVGFRLLLKSILMDFAAHSILINERYLFSASNLVNLLSCPSCLVTCNSAMTFPAIGLLDSRSYRMLALD